MVPSFYGVPPLSQQLYSEERLGEKFDFKRKLALVHSQKKEKTTILNI